MPMAPAGSPFGQSILFVAYEAGHINTALAIADRFGSDGTYKTLIWCPFYLPETEQYVRAAAGRGACYVYETTQLGASADLALQLGCDLPERQAIPRPFERPMPPSLEAFHARGHQQSPEQMQALFARVADAAEPLERDVEWRRQLLARLDVRAVVLAEDNAERDSALWIEAARRHRIPSVVLSYGALSLRGAEMAYRHSPAHQIPDGLDDLIAAFFDKWRRVGEGYRITRLPVETMLGHEWLGIASDNPWLVNFGRYDRLAVESDEMAAAYTEQGLDPRCIAVVGIPMFDRLAAVAADRDAARQHWCDQAGVTPNHRIIVTALPPNQFGSRPAPEFADYSALIDGWTEALLGQPETLVLISPHPTIPAVHLDRLRAQGCLIVSGSVAEVLPLADLYVASVSTTIKWSLASGIPVVNYDCYRYRYPHFSGVPGVTEVDTLVAMQQAVNGLLVAPRLAAETAIARDGRHRWGRIDGHAMTRVAALIEELQMAASD